MCDVSFSLYQVFMWFVQLHETTKQLHFFALTCAKFIQ